MSKRTKEFRGAIVPNVYDETDYEGMRQAQCNSVDGDLCDEIECEECLFDEGNADLYVAWRKARDKAIKKALKETGSKL